MANALFFFYDVDTRAYQAHGLTSPWAEDTCRTLARRDDRSCVLTGVQ